MAITILQSSVVQLGKRVEGSAAALLDIALVLAAVATITMALLELLKVLVRARPLYHRWAVRRWTDDQAVFDELLSLTVGEKTAGNALFDQPTDKMMGQLQAAANLALEYPTHFPKLYFFLTTVPLIREAGGPEGEPAGRDDQKLWREFTERLEEQTEAASRSVAAGDAEVSEAAETDESVLRAASRARGRLDHFVARRLDAFQTRTEYVWARANQVVAVGASALFLAYLLYRPGAQPQSWLVASAFGGMIAPLAKDVVTALAGLRARGTP